MLTKLLRGFFSKLTHPIGRAISAIGLTANAITVIGTLIVSTSTWFIADGQLFVGGLILLAGAAFDMLDGAVARAVGSTVRGKFLDSTLDRFSDALVFAGVLWYLRDAAAWKVGLAIAGMILGFLTSYIRARAESLDMECQVGIAERAERTILIAAGLIFDQLVIALIVLCVVSGITVIQRFLHVWGQTKPGPR